MTTDFQPAVRTRHRQTHQLQCKQHNVKIVLHGDHVPLSGPEHSKMRGKYLSHSTKVPHCIISKEKQTSSQVHNDAIVNKIHLQTEPNNTQQNPQVCRQYINPEELFVPSDCGVFMSMMIITK
ncbi:hypothetical protein Droror1_Dr00013509 [Drosera rotundifolia]